MCASDLMSWPRLWAITFYIYLQWAWWVGGYVTAMLPWLCNISKSNSCLLQNHFAKTGLSKEELHPKPKLNMFVHYFKITNTFYSFFFFFFWKTMWSSWSKLSEKLKHVVKILIGPAILMLLIKISKLLFWSFFLWFWSITWEPYGLLKF